MSIFEFHFTVRKDQYEAFKFYNKNRNIKLMRLVGNGLDTHQNSLKVQTSNWEVTLTQLQNELRDASFEIIRSKVETLISTQESVLYYEAHWKGISSEATELQLPNFLWCLDKEYDNPKYTYRTDDKNLILKMAQFQIPNYKCDALEAVIFDDNRSLDTVWENS